VTVDKNRLGIIGALLAMTVVAVLGFVLGVQPQLVALAAADASLAAAAQRNTEHAADVAALKKQFASLNELRAELVPLQASVPNATELPAFVTQIGALAEASGLNLSGLTVADAQPYTPVDAADATTDATADAAGAQNSPVTNALITADNFASLAVQITVTGPAGSALDFVNGLQTGSRLFLVTGLRTSATDTPGSVDATISGLIYVLVPMTGDSAVSVG
jgi:hypothetical protein